MASSNDASISKRRLGRRRLPPLEPGPDLSFVVANHPDQFRAGKTMRHVRSHVMYKQRTGRTTTLNDRASNDLHRSASERVQSSPVPFVSTPEATSPYIDLPVPPQLRQRRSTWTRGSLDSRSNSPAPFALQTIVDRVVSPIAAASAQRAPPVFKDVSASSFSGTYSARRNQLDVLKQHHMDSCSLFCNGQQCLENVCSDHMTFLSHVSVSCVYQDLKNGLLHDSNTTMSAKTRVLSEMADQLTANDATILTTLHLLLSEAGNSDESAFEVHSRGLKGLVQRRGGLDQMPPKLATYVTLLLITLAILKGHDMSSILPASRSTSHYTEKHYPFVSPLYAPHGDFTALQHSCSAHTLAIITDMYKLSQESLNRRDNANTTDPQKSPQLSHNLPPNPSPPHNWTDESIRLASLIHKHTLVHQTTLSTTSKTPHHLPSPGTQTLLHALLTALEHTDTHHCWGPLRSVFLWVCLTGGAAAWGCEAGEMVSERVAWARKCFSLWAVRAVGMGGGCAGATLEGLWRGLRF